MFGISNNKLYFMCILLIVLVAAIFLIDYRIKQVVKNELVRCQKKKILQQRKMAIKRQKLLEQEHRQGAQQNTGGEMDSYINPMNKVDDQDDEDYPDANNRDYEETKLNKENIGMRAFM